VLLQAPESCVLIHTASSGAWSSDCGNGDAMADACAAGAVGGGCWALAGAGAGAGVHLPAGGWGAHVGSMSYPSRTWLLLVVFSAGIGGTVYVVGGTPAGGQLSTAIRTYSPASKSWSEAASLPSGEACS
jgi:hypothetical protein